MNVGYYVIMFDRATDVLLDALGLGTAYAARTNCSTFALAAHVTYPRELVEGDPVSVETSPSRCSGVLRAAAAEDTAVAPPSA